MEKLFSSKSLISSPFILICISGFFAIFSSTISKSPVLPLYAVYLGANSADVGLIASVSAFTGILVSIPAGMLSDKIGRKKMLFISLFIFASAPFLYLFVNNIVQLAFLRFYHGFATAIFVPVAMAAISDIHSKARGEKLGWFSSATLGGRFIAPIVGGVIISFFAYSQGYNYKLVYWLCGFAAIAALVIFLFIKDFDSETKNNKYSWDQAWNSFKNLISNKIITLTSLVEAGILFTYGAFETFLPIYCISKGLSAYEVGFILSAQVITIALTKPIMGKFSDKHGRKPQIILGAVIGAICISCITLIANFLFLLIISIVFGLSISTVTSATAALISDKTDKDSRGSAMGILGSIMDIGHTTGPIVTGFIVLILGYKIAFISAGLLLIFLVLIFKILVKDHICKK
ncbi:MAG: MFS transporter [Thermodesulfovibrionales bacterium]|nr:MFS transporter [Thermodesulfovibrionales bacterium]